MFHRLWFTTGGGHGVNMQSNSNVRNNPHIRDEFGLFAVVVLLVISLGMLCSCASSASDAPDGASQESATATQDEVNRQEATEDSAVSDVGIAESNSGMSLEGIPDKQIINAEQLYDVLQQGSGNLFIIDLRPAYAYDKAHIEDAANIPAGSQLEVRIDEIPTDEPVYLVDLNGTRIAESWQTLVDLGFNSESIYVVSDGMQAWMDSGYPTKDTKDTSRRRC